MIFWKRSIKTIIFLKSFFTKLVSRVNIIIFYLLKLADILFCFAKSLDWSFFIRLYFVRLRRTVSLSSFGLPGPLLAFGKRPSQSCDDGCSPSSLAVSAISPVWSWCYSPDPAQLPGSFASQTHLARQLVQGRPQSLASLAPRDKRSLSQVVAPRELRSRRWESFAFPVGRSRRLLIFWLPTCPILGQRSCPG